MEEFLPIFSEAKKSKDYGTLEDFMECMKLYDKAENGTMLGAELNHILLSLGKLKTTSLLSAFLFINGPVAFWRWFSPLRAPSPGLCLATDGVKWNAVFSRSLGVDSVTDWQSFAFL